MKNESIFDERNLRLFRAVQFANGSKIVLNLNIHATTAFNSQWKMKNLPSRRRPHSFVVVVCLSSVLIAELRAAKRSPMAISI